MGRVAAPLRAVPPASDSECMTAPGSALALLETKLFAPRWTGGLVTRPELIERLRKGVRGKVTVIAAPAGFGKSTLLAEWLTDHDGQSARAWLSLDSGDNDPALFWTGIARAIRVHHPDFAEGLLATLEAERSPSQTTVTLLLNQLTTLGADVILILDDYHVIETAGIHSALAFVIDHLPPNLHLVLVTRSEPPLPLARLRAHGQLTELRTDDLRFTTGQVATFLETALNFQLSDADVSALHERTEGWVAGLKLAALSLSDRRDVSAFVRSFSGNHRYITDYLVEEVLDRQPPATRRFLLATSILERLSASLCDAVCGESHSQEILDALHRGNLFVVSLDDRRGWYRYHHLLVDVLRAYAEREAPDHVQELHLRASEWYERNGAISDAVHHARSAGDQDRMAQLLEQNWAPRDRSHASRRWLDDVRSLPTEVVAGRPWLNMGYAWGLLNAGELEAAELTLAAVEAGLEVEDSSETALGLEVVTARVYLAQARGQGAAKVEDARRLLALTPAADHEARATARALVALAEWAAGDLDRAFDSFSGALMSMRQAGLELDALRGEFVLGDIRAMQGRLREAARIYEAGLLAAAPHPAAETDELYLGRAEIHLECGELSQAHHLLKALAEKASGARHIANRHRWCVALSRVAQAEKDPVRALNLLTEAEATHRRDPLPVARSVAAMRSRIQLTHGDVDAAERWADEEGIGSSDPLTFLGEYDHLTLVRILTARGRLEEALGLLHRLSAATHAGGRLRRHIEVRALEALVYHRLGRTAHALDALSEALEEADAEGHVRVFEIEGTPMRDLLRVAAARGVAGAWTRRLLGRFDAPVPTPDEAGATGILTRREHEILRLIAAGLRNQEIARQLFISPATVKRHIANVYAKLDAGHRTDALRRAEALHLL